MKFSVKRTGHYGRDFGDRRNLSTLHSLKVHYPIGSIKGDQNYNLNGLILSFVASVEQSGCYHFVTCCLSLNISDGSL
jgi:hypothetical protein